MMGSAPATPMLRATSTGDTWRVTSPALDVLASFINPAKKHTVCVQCQPTDVKMYKKMNQRHPPDTWLYSRKCTTRIVLKVSQSRVPSMRLDLESCVEQLAALHQLCDHAGHFPDGRCRVIKSGREGQVGSGHHHLHHGVSELALMIHGNWRDAVSPNKYSSSIRIHPEAGQQVCAVSRDICHEEVLRGSRPGLDLAFHDATVSHRHFPGNTVHDWRRVGVTLDCQSHSFSSSFCGWLPLA